MFSYRLDHNSSSERLKPSREYRSRKTTESAPQCCFAHTWWSRIQSQAVSISRCSRNRVWDFAPWGRKVNHRKWPNPNIKKGGQYSKHHLRHRLPLSHAFYLQKEKENRIQAHGIGDYLPEERGGGGGWRKMMMHDQGKAIMSSFLKGGRK